MVTVTKSTTGEFWRMEYMGQADIIDEEPTEAEKSRFMRSVNEQRARERFEAAHPIPAGHGTQVVQVN